MPTATADTRVSKECNRRARPDRDRAKELLAVMLADGPARSADVEAAAARLGISRRTLCTARREMGVKSERLGVRRRGLLAVVVRGPPGRQGRQA